jgi:predicted PurR-regulated permease PerM
MTSAQTHGSGGHGDDDVSRPDRGLHEGALYTGRLIVIAAGLALVGVLVFALAEIVIPFVIGLILAALLVPLSSFLQRHSWPKLIAVITVWVVVFAVLVALTLLVTEQIRTELPKLERQVAEVVDSAKALLATHPFGLTDEKIANYASQVVNWLRAHASQLGAGAAVAGSAVIQFLEGIFIVIFVTLFSLIDGSRIWTWVTRLFPRRARARIIAAGEAGWRTLANFIRIQLLVAAVDAIGIGLGAWILGAPLAVPIGVLVFLGSLIPVVGAIVSGIIAVAIVLIFNGWVAALIMLGVVLLVQQLEAHLLQPLLTGSAVNVHPLGIVLGVTAGTAVAGIAGAFFAVPLIATANSMIRAARRAGGSQPSGDGETATGLETPSGSATS